MNARILCLAVATLFAASVVVLAKDDPAAIAAAREAVKKDLKAKKCWFTQDLKYVIDTTKLKDTRWEFKEAQPPSDPDQGAMLEADFPSGNPEDTSASIHVLFSKCIQINNQTHKEYSSTFQAVGKTVKVADTKGTAEAELGEFLATCVEPDRKEAKGPTKKAIGAGDAWWSTAIGGDKDSKKRVRKDWWVWSASEKSATWTWQAHATISEKFVKNDDWYAKLEELMKNFKELSDPRLK